MKVFFIFFMTFIFVSACKKESNTDLLSQASHKQKTYPVPIDGLDREIKSLHIGSIFSEKTDSIKHRKIYTQLNEFSKQLGIEVKSLGDSTWNEDLGFFKGGSFFHSEYARINSKQNVSNINFNKDTIPKLGKSIGFYLEGGNVLPSIDKNGNYIRD